MVPENHKLVRKCTTKPNFALECTEIPNQKNRVNLYLLWVYHRPYLIYYKLALAHTNLRNYNKGIWFHEQDLVVARRVSDLVWIAQAVHNITKARDPLASQEMSVEQLLRTSSECNKKRG